MTGSLPSPWVKQSRLNLDGIENLSVETGDKGVLSLVLAVLLRFIKDFGGEVFGEKSGWLSFGVQWVLAKPSGVIRVSGRLDIDLQGH